MNKLVGYNSNGLTACVVCHFLANFVIRKKLATSSTLKYYMTCGKYDNLHVCFNYFEIIVRI